MEKISIQRAQASPLTTGTLGATAAGRRHENNTGQRRPEAVKAASGQNAGDRGTGTRAGSEATLEDLRKVTEDLNQYFSNARAIRFQISEDLTQVVVQIVDKRSQEVIRSIPPERLLEFKDTFKAMSTGILLDDHA